MWIKQRDRHGCGTIFRQDLNKFSGADMSFDVIGGDLYEPKARQATSNICFCIVDGDAPLATEGIYTDKAFSQGYRFQPGLADDEQAKAWSTFNREMQEHGTLVFA
jgi:hypothetical protein